MNYDYKNLNKLLKEIPKGLTDEIPNYILNKSLYKRIGIINDLHIPFLDTVSFKLVIKHFKEFKIDTLIINGDFLDFYGISKFLKDPTKVDLQTELDFGIKVLQILRKVFPKVKILFKLGNHEARLEKYIWTHSELLKLRCLELENLLELNNSGIELIKNKQLIQYDNFIIAHGDEIAASGLNPAKLTLNKNYSNIIFGHLHRTDTFKHQDRKGGLIESYSIGCLCQKMDYWLHNNWNTGALTILNNKGKIKINNFRIETGNIV